MVHRAAVSLGEGVDAAGSAARDTLAAAWSAQSVARQASSEALSAISRATSAAASARNEGSVLLEEVMDSVCLEHSIVYTLHASLFMSQLRNLRALHDIGRSRTRVSRRDSRRKLVKIADRLNISTLCYRINFVAREVYCCLPSVWSPVWLDGEVSEAAVLLLATRKSAPKL